MAAEGAASMLLALLTRCVGGSPVLVDALCSALRYVAVNDDICKVRTCPIKTRLVLNPSPVFSPNYGHMVLPLVFV